MIGRKYHGPVNPSVNGSQTFSETPALAAGGKTLLDPSGTPLTADRPVDVWRLGPGDEHPNEGKVEGMSDMVGTNGVIAVGFTEDGNWELRRVEGRDYRWSVVNTTSGGGFHFVDLDEATLAFREVIV